MGQCDQVFVSITRIQGVRDESEDFRGDAVDGGKPVLQGPNQAEDLESVHLEILDLKPDTGSATTQTTVSLVQPQPCWGLHSWY